MVEVEGSSRTLYSKHRLTEGLREGLRAQRSGHARPDFDGWWIRGFRCAAPPATSLPAFPGFCLEYTGSCGGRFSARERIFLSYLQEFQRGASKG